MNYSYKTQGICARSIDVEIDENNIIKNVRFHGGCDGNHQGIINLLCGMRADEVIEKLEGIKCGFKSTSCPDQLACALKEITK